MAEKLTLQNYIVITLVVVRYFTEKLTLQDYMPLKNITATSNVMVRVEYQGK